MAVKSKWDLYERDRETSATLMRYLAKHPDRKVLLFSGLMHTMRDSERGCFLAHYLDSLMQRPNVSVIQTSRIVPQGEANARIEEYRA